MVDRDDLSTRRAAAMAVTKAYLTAPQAWLFGLVGAVLETLVIVVMLDRSPGAWWGDPGSLTELAAAVLGLWVAFTIAYAVLCGALIYFTPRKDGSRLCYLRTTAAEAAVCLRLDERRGALLHDVQATTAGAWPRDRGAGLVLVHWVRDLVHAEGSRLTLTAATPRLVRTYRRHGFLDDGRTAGVLKRLASRPRAADGGELTWGRPANVHARQGPPGGGGPFACCSSW